MIKGGVGHRDQKTWRCANGPRSGPEEIPGHLIKVYKYLKGVHTRGGKSFFCLLRDDVM